MSRPPHHTTISQGTIASCEGCCWVFAWIAVWKKGWPVQMKAMQQASQDSNARINGLLTSHTIPVLEHNRAIEKQATGGPPDLPDVPANAEGGVARGSSTPDTPPSTASQPNGTLEVSPFPPPSAQPVTCQGWLSDDLLFLESAVRLLGAVGQALKQS